MYTADIDGLTLYDPVNGFILEEAKVKQELGKVGSFDFTIRPDHPAYPYIEKMKSVVTVREGSRIVFRGRVLNTEEGFHNELSVECESDLAYLLDSTVRPYEYQGDMAGMLSQLVQSHNERVDDWKKFTIGNITVTDTNDYVHYSSTQYPTTWDEIQDKLIDTHGGYLQVRYSGSVTYLDYLDDTSLLSNQPVKFGLNLLDFGRKITGEDVYTVIIPLGAKIESEGAEGETEERLTIESVNNGLDYLYDEDAVEAYGWIEHVEEWDDVTQAANLKTKAAAALAQNIMLGSEISVTAVDLSGLGYDYSSFQLGTYVKVESEPHGLSATFLVSELSIDLNDPSGSELCLGATGKTFTDIVTGTKPDIGKVEQIVGDYIDGSTVQIKELVQTLIEQTESTIKLEVKNELQSQFTQIVQTETNQTVSNVTTEYYLSTSSSSLEGGQWSTSRPTWQAGKYVWMRTKTVLKSGAVSYSAAACITGPQGASGTSVTVTSTKSEYQKSTSGTDIPTGTWLSTPPAVSAGQYLWTRGTTTYSDGSKLVMYSVSRNGTVGSAGADGRGISSYTIQYYLSTSKTAQTGGSWTETPPLWTAGKYLWTRAKIVYTNPTETAYTQPSVDSSWEAVNQIEVGARNLIRNSNFSHGAESWTAEGSPVLTVATDATFGTCGKYIATDLFTDVTNPQRLYTLPTVQDGSATILTFYAKSSASATLHSARGGNNHDLTHATTTAWKKFERTYPAGSSGSVTFHGVGTFYITNVKLETGNKPTDWTPAPEDIDTSISGIQDTTDGLQSAIDGVASDLDSTASDLAGLQETTDEVFEIVQTNSTQITQLLQDNESFNFNFQELETVVTTLNGQVTTEYNERLKYIRFVDGEIWLGKDPEANEDDFKVVISNERIRFLQNNVEVAYISNDQLYITNARIIERLEIGDFAFFPRDNGNMTLRYIG